MAKRRGTHIIELGTHCGESLGRLLAELCGENVEVLEEVGEFAHALVLGLERRGKVGTGREEGMRESVANGGRGGGTRGADGGAEDRGRGRTGPRNREA